MLTNQPKILSLLYRDCVEDLNQALKKLGLDYLALYVTFNNGQKFVISNLYHFVEAYYAEELYQEDYQADLTKNDERDFFLEGEKLFTSERLTREAETRFHIYRAYFLVRHSPECKIVLGAAASHPIDNFTRIYEQTYEKFSRLGAEFFLRHVDIMKSTLPDYMHSIILTDAEYAREIMMNKIKPTVLTDRQIDCLLWASRGKNAGETAEILQLASRTVTSYRTQVIKKLECVNMPQAVYEAFKRGCLGVFTEPRRTSLKFSSHSTPTSFDLLNSIRISPGPRR